MNRSWVKIYVAVAIALSLWLSMVYGQTPAKPYPDVIEGDVLTATWLMGTFNVLFNWAQAENASMAQVLAGTISGNKITASVTVSIATSAAHLIWDSTTLPYVTTVGSGALFFDGVVVAVATGGSNAGCWKVWGALLENAASGTVFIQDSVYMSFVSTSTMDLVASYTSGGKLMLIASSPASTTWKATLDTLETDY